MMYRCSLILSVIAVAACTSPEENRQSEPAAVESTASTTVQNPPSLSPSSARPQTDPTSAIPKPNDNYWMARKALLAAGYTPVDAVEPVDGNRQDFMVCPEGMEAQRSMSECPSELVALVEVEACAGTGMGNCKTVWTAPDRRRLTIYTIDGPQPGIVSSVEWSQN